MGGCKRLQNVKYVKYCAQGGLTVTTDRRESTLLQCRHLASNFFKCLWKFRLGAILVRTNRRFHNTFWEGGG